MALKDILAAKAASPVAPAEPSDRAAEYNPAPTVGETVVIVPEAEPEVEPVPEVPGPAGSYRPHRLQRFHKADGTLVLPVDGFFVPKDQEEYDMLEHYATQWDMVEPQGE